MRIYVLLHNAPENQSLMRLPLVRPRSRPRTSGPHAPQVPISFGLSGDARQFTTTMDPGEISSSSFMA